MRAGFGDGRRSVKAVVVEALGPDYAGVVLRDIPTPKPGPGEVLVRVRAASVNFPDLLQTEGKYQHKPALPFVAGMEAAGEVVEAGPDAGFQHGDRVVGAARPAAIPATVAAAQAGRQDDHPQRGLGAQAQDVVRAQQGHPPPAPAPRR